MFVDTKQFFETLDVELEKLNDFFSGRVALFEEMFPFMAGRLEQVSNRMNNFSVFILTDMCREMLKLILLCNGARD